MIKQLLLLCTFTIALQLKPQSLANYGSVRNTGITYASVNTLGSPFQSWRNATSGTSDDNRSDFTSIGFDFWYNGVRYTQFSASTNGFLDFSTSSDDGGPVADDFGYSNSSFTSSNINNSTNPAIAAFYDDLTTQGTNDPLGNSIKYYLSGAAPNRTLTVEWLNLTASGNSSPNLNFQVQLVEGSGRIIINYGSMANGTQIFSYSMGLNGPVISSTPSAAELKELQSANANSFGNTIQNNLSAIPASNSQYIFTPPVPAAPSGVLSFSGISQTGMTLSWTNWATNEVGYAVYNSTDGTNFSFVGQTLANVTSTAIAGLVPSTTYYWRLYAITEGCLSSALTGTQATTAAGNKVSAGSGNWSAASTWSPNGVPTAADNVTIGNGHIVQIQTSGQCNNLVVGGGTSGILEYNNGGTAYTFTVNNNLTINAGGIFRIPANSNATSSLTLKGNVINNGTLNFAADLNSLVKAYFRKDGSLSVSGTGATTQFHTMDIDLGSTGTNTLDISTSSFSATTGFLTLTNGFFKLSSTNVATLSPFTSSVSFARNSGMWLNTPNTTYSFVSTVASQGKFIVSGGTVNIGDAANEDLYVSGTLSLTSCVLNVAGKIYSGVNSLTCSINGGTITVPTVGSTNTGSAPFQISGAGSSFSQTGGKIIVQYEGGSGAQDLGYVNTASSGAVTGGTLQLGTALTPAGSTMIVNSFHPVGNFSISTANVTAKLQTNSLTVVNNMTMLGNLFSSSLSISLGGNWTNTGIFTAGSNTVTFNSAATQSLSRTGGETFNHLVFLGSGLKTFGSNATATGNFSIGTGSGADMSASNYTLNVAGSFINNGTFNARSGLVFLNGSSAQTVGGSSGTSFFDLTLNNTAGAVLSNSANLIGTLNLNNGTLNLNGQAFTMVSTATATARIAQITGSGDITGNVTVQRFAPGGTTGWALFGTCISSSLTYQDWDDNIYISCPTCPDGFAGMFYSIYTYDETVSGVFDNPLSYVPINTISDPIVPGKGYWVYLGDGFYTTNNITVDVTGSVRKFNFTIPLSYSNYGSSVNDGWNLIHNPYPSAISWAALRGSTSGIDNAIYGWNADLNGGTGSHATYINGVSSPAVGSGGIGDVIPMGQGFYVHSTGATALNASESIKISGNPSYLKSNSQSSPPLIRFFLDGMNNYHDETVLYTQAGASDNFDVAYDAYKLPAQDYSIPFIALEKGADKFQVNGIPPLAGTFTMDLKTLTGYSGTYTLSASNFSSFPSGACVTVFDKFTNTTTDLKTSGYVFNLSDTTTVARFRINVSFTPLNVISTVIQPSCQQPVNARIVALPAGTGPWNYSWKDGFGGVVKSSVARSSADTLAGMLSGDYHLQVNSVAGCDENNSDFNIISVSVPVSQFSSADTLFNLSQNSQVDFTNNSMNAVSQFWDFGDNNGSSTLLSPSYNYLSPGIYQVKLVNISGSGCLDSASKNIVVQDVFIGLKENSQSQKGLVVKTLENNDYLIEQQMDDTRGLKIELRDVSGKLLIDYGSFSTNHLELPVHLQKFTAGVYYLSIRSGDDIHVLRLPVR
jgi:hypothetical protein